MKFIIGLDARGLAQVCFFNNSADSETAVRKFLKENPDMVEECTTTVEVDPLINAGDEGVIEALIGLDNAFLNISSFNNSEVFLPFLEQCILEAYRTCQLANPK